MSRFPFALTAAVLVLAGSGAHAGSIARTNGQSGGYALGGEAAILDALKARGAAEGRSTLLSADSNIAMIRQSGSAQYSTINQRGRGNTATADIRNGSGNVTAQVQTGERNISAVTIRNGSNNQILTDQQGSDNKIGLVFKDADNTSVTWTQIGSGLNAAGREIVIERSTATPMPIAITQTSR